MKVFFLVQSFVYLRKVAPGVSARRLSPPSALFIQPVHLAKVSGHIGGRHRGCYQLPYGSGRRRCGDGGSYTSAGRQIFQNALCNHQQNKSPSQNNLLIFANLTLM